MSFGRPSKPSSELLQTHKIPKGQPYALTRDTRGVKEEREREIGEFRDDFLIATHQWSSMRSTAFGLNISWAIIEEKSADAEDLISSGEDGGAFI